MKYLTKEYLTLEWLSYVNKYVKQSKSAENRNEAFYQNLYEKKYAEFLNFEKMSDWYRNGTKELEKTDAFTDDPAISAKERERRKEFKKTNEDLIDKKPHNASVHKFDEDLCKRKFERRVNNQIEIFSQLPKEIFDKIADIRVFALGYASAEVKRLLHPYCTKLRKIIQQLKEKACAETSEAENLLSEKPDLNGYNDCLLAGIEIKDGNIYLNAISNDCLIIENGEIIEGKEKTIFPFNEEKPDSMWSKIVAAELHKTKENKFEAHFLISNGNETEKEDLWYLTVRGTDIRQTD